MMNSTPREATPTVGKILPQLANNTTVDSAGIDCSKAQQFVATFVLGATDTTTDVKVMSCDDAAGTNAIDITGLTATQLSATDDGSIVELLLRQANLPSTQSHFLVRITVGNGTLGSNVSCVIKAKDVRYEGASNFEDAAVAQVVSL